MDFRTLHQMPGMTKPSQATLTQAIQDIDLSEADVVYLVETEGLSRKDIADQADLLGRRSLHVQLVRACKLKDGLRVLSEADQKRYAEHFGNWRAKGEAHRFIPASGAASRLFAALDWCLHVQPVPSWDDLQSMSKESGSAKACVQILSRLKDFPFEPQLRSVVAPGDAHPEMDWDDVLRQKGPRTVIEAILGPTGLGLAQRPKALIPFHRHGSSVRTALDEQVLETERLVCDGRGESRVHFTVSPEHRDLFSAACQENATRLQARGTHLRVAFSEQSPQTRTLALCDGKVFREQGKPVLRPGGHGSLLRNLESVAAPLVFVKNIDNVAREETQPQAEWWHGALAGLLLELQSQAHGFSEALEGHGGEEVLSSIESWLGTNMGWSTPPSWRDWKVEDRIAYAKQALHRPIRVCGMVANQGEPGGGPFWVLGRNGQVTPQIVESSQVDSTSADQKAILSQATHFNPVDFVCGLLDYRGKPYELAAFSDPEAWFMAHKPQGASMLTVLERPGLWNGAMAHWFTVFVEIPVSLFNPVKTIADLLRPAHLGG
jgi:Domain of unknown function (DUF4301)